MPDTYSIKPQIYNISHANTNVDFVTKKDTSCDTLHIHLNPIHLKYTHITKLPDFVGVQQLHSSCAFMEVISERDAAMPGLDFTAASPKTDVDGFGTGEDFAECGDVDGLHSDVD